MSGKSNHMPHFPKGLQVSCFRRSDITEVTSNEEQSNMHALRTVGTQGTVIQTLMAQRSPHTPVLYTHCGVGQEGWRGWNVSSLWSPAVPNEPTRKVTRWLKPWSLSLICARVMIFFMCVCVRKVYATLTKCPSPRFCFIIKWQIHSKGMTLNLFYYWVIIRMSQ